jgi:hypothetical protein
MSEAQGTPTGRRPWHLWVIGIVAVLWNAIGAFDYVMTQTKNEAYMGQFTPEQLDYFYGLPAWVVAFWAIAVWGGLLGAVLLLLRKRLAVWVFLISLVCMVTTTFHNYVLSNGMEIAGGASEVAFTAIIFLVGLGLVLYAGALGRRRILV